MARQHNKPYIVRDSTVHALEATEYRFDEAWLRDFIFAHPQALPVNEIEPVFDALIPVCTELRTKAGKADILFVNESGLVTLIECKLWKNPEARREVIAQILDYAKELSRWSHDDLQKAVQEKTGKKLYDLVCENSEELDESTFNDSVSLNLKRGRFLLLVVGEGIRESIEMIAEFLQQHAHLNFSFALVEMGVFKLPEEMGKGYLVHPRLVTRTVEIERAVIRLEEGKLISEMPVPVRQSDKLSAKNRTTITEQDFYERLPNSAKELREFFIKARGLGLGLDSDIQKDSLRLKLTLGDSEYSLGSFKKDGTFQNWGISKWKSEESGHPEIGKEYLEQLAQLLDGRVDTPENRLRWTVRQSNNLPITISEILAVQNKWLEVIRKTADKLLAVQDS